MHPISEFHFRNSRPVRMEDGYPPLRLAVVWPRFAHLGSVAYFPQCFDHKEIGWEMETPTVI